MAEQYLCGGDKHDERLSTWWNSSGMMRYNLVIPGIWMQHQMDAFESYRIHPQTETMALDTPVITRLS
jgi:hypothetical protein